MHVIYDRLRKAINLETGVIKYCTCTSEMDLTRITLFVVEIFMCAQSSMVKFNGSAKVIKVGLANEDVTCRILTVKGPYTTACRAYTSFSSHCRPNVYLVQKSMQDLVAAGLGIFKVINKLKMFL
ncbi:unnamed protein product [Pocillopora meandrina]|uniref:Uncharacterized protein n=1 Tax=Pocillopora meandrina TaxID=46732 RepID=A0AAU9Y0V3_9CNID|nr:unnamed protein product [Pocillopora meandrina]